LSDKQEKAITGSITGRSWVASEAPNSDIIESMKSNWPCFDSTPSLSLLSIVASRGIVSSSKMEQFFYPKKENLHNPLLLNEMEKAAKRVLQAAENSEKVAVHGDFDVDGLTGTALIAQMLRSLKVNGNSVDLQAPFVPDRHLDGFGVADRMIEKWASDSVNLLITIDTGSSATAEVNKASKLGMDVVILDHHLFESKPEGAHALVNPRTDGDKYPNSELCGVAVGFKLVQALRLLDQECLPSGFENEVIDLAALGLVSDQMSLTGENRAIVQWGMKKIRSVSRIRPGIKSLFDIANLELGTASTTDIAYQIAPRLNACGRIGDVQVALDLLSEKLDNSTELARIANQENIKRRAKDLSMREDAERLASVFIDRGDIGLVLGSEDWHRGVVGIGASRMVELFNVPSILFSFEKGEARGSARSIPGIDVKSVLDNCSEHLVRYGGHAMAAGLTLKCKNLDSFRESFLTALGNASGECVVKQCYDLELPFLDMSAENIASLLKETELVEPYGEGNRRPIFRCNQLRMKRPPVPMGKTGEHLKFSFAGIGREFISFGSGRTWAEEVQKLGGSSEAVAQSWDVLFQLVPNKWRPRNSANVDPVQIQLMDIMLSKS
jgi:single-stranded-DNA-specific exonuclease